MDLTMKNIYLIMFCLVYTIQTNAQEIQWEKELSLPPFNNQKSQYQFIIETTDSCYLLTTYTHIDFTDTNVTTIFKIDKNGNEIWKKHFYYEFSEISNFAIKTKLLCEIENGKYLLMNIYLNSPAYHFGYHITILDKNGNLINEYDHIKDSIPFYGDVNCLYYHGFIYAFYLTNSNKNIIIDKYDTSGKLITRKQVDSIEQGKIFMLYNPKIKKDKKLLFTAQVWNSVKIEDSFLYILDNDLNFVEKINLDFNKYVSPDCIELSDSSIIFKTTLNVGVNAPETKRIIFLKYSKDYTKQWEKFTGDSKFDACKSFCPTNDIGFLAGFSRFHFYDNSGYSVSDFHIIKYDSSFTHLWDIKKNNDTLKFIVENILLTKENNFLCLTDVIDTSRNYRNVHVYKISDNTSSVKDETNNYLYCYPPYPVPATNTVRSLIYWDTSLDIENDDIAVYDIFGNKVAGKDKITIDKQNAYSGLLSWDCSNVPDGIYLIRLIHGTETRTM
ncbi:hypothetical protein D9V86_00060, partial [Bacteroidetes/Chlorobi group bacterium ChocPot_Mid]